MSTPEQPTGTTGGTTGTAGTTRPAGYGIGTTMTGGARLPIPGNAEFAVYFLAVIFLILTWIIADSFDTPGFTVLFTVLTFGYMLSRGIAKASRVLEQ